MEPLNVILTPLIVQMLWQHPTIIGSIYQGLVPPDPFIAHIDIDLDELSGMPPNEIWVSDTILTI